jgi:HD-GYP domain-containing protein (c-di-GMP phosphodiesterase class II)
VSPLVVFHGTMERSVLAYLGYGLFGILLAVMWLPADVGWASALLLLLPLFVARWAYAQYAEEQRAYDRTVSTLMAAVETKDLYTRGHSERVSTASVLVARAIGMREDRVASLRYAGLLHDVGKLGVPTQVLQKSGGLDEREIVAIQRHPGQGHEIVREIEFLDEAKAGILHHHERIDGLGYPKGQVGDEIPEFARVIAVADAFDSMTTTRSYRGARSIEEAVVELRRCAGTQFDPRMVEALVRGLDEHGWNPEVVPVFIAPEPDEVFDQNHRSYDHDDPTSSLVEEQS